MDEGKRAVLCLLDLFESLARGLDHSAGLDGLENVGVLLLNGVVLQ